MVIARILRALPLMLLAGFSFAACAGGVELPVAVGGATALETVPPPPPNAYMCPKTVSEPADQRSVGSSGSYLAAGRHLLDVRPGVVPPNARVRFSFAEPAAEYIVVQGRREQGALRGRIRMSMSTARCGEGTAAPVGVMRHGGGPTDQWVALPRGAYEIMPDRSGIEHQVVFEIDDFSNYALAAPN